MSYLFNHQHELERQRLNRLESACDPWSIHNLEKIDPGPGWKCLEVGAGAGSMARWLSQRVGSRGLIVATDLEIDFLRDIQAENIEIRRHDLVTDPLEPGLFDLIHSRAVIDHLAEREKAVQKLVAALRPGGWLTIECGDFSTVRAMSESDEEAEFFRRAFQAVLEVAHREGANHFYGRHLGMVFRQSGLTEVSLAGLISEWDGSHPLGELYHLTFQRLGPRVVEVGKLRQQDLDRLLEMLASPDFRGVGHIIYFASGKRPLEGS